MNRLIVLLILNAEILNREQPQSSVPVLMNLKHAQTVDHLIQMSVVSKEIGSKSWEGDRICELNPHSVS